MNRTLRRPMFRTGGSAEGITSGLDVPKLNASRQNFQNGGTLTERYDKAMKEIESRRAPRSSDFNDFLINLGLDLVSRPRSGNIFQQVATSAAGPYQRFTERKSTARQEQDKLSQALIGDIMEQMSEEKIAEIEARGESGKKQFEYKGKYEDYQALIKQQRELEDRKRKLEEQNVATKDLQTDEVISAQYDEEIRRINAQLEDNAKLQNLFQDKEEDAVRAAILKGISNGIFTFEDLITYDETGVPPKSDESLAKGGRVGLQMGGEAMPAAMPTDQGPVQASPAQSLTFEELRSRLPNTITDDIVTLIASSEQALADFANIQTQQDVNAFNQKYEVNLQLPAEA
jgi:hypothetical protein